MSYLKDREIWLSSVPTGNPPAGYVWVFIQNGVFVVRDSNGVDKIMATTTGTVTNATSASYVEYSNVANKPALISGSSQVSYTGLSDIPAGIVSGSAQVSFNGIVDKPTLVSGSSQVTYSGLTGVPAGIVSSSTQITGYNIFATTGSNQFNGSQAITGSLTVTGQVVAQTLNVQQVTSSIVFSSGSNIFGNSLSNTQQFTGSVSVTGSLTVVTAGTELQVTSTGVNLGNALTDNHIISGSLRVNPNGLFVSGSGDTGIGTSSPNTYSFGGGGRFLTLYNPSGYSLLGVISNGTSPGGIALGNETIRRASIDVLNGSDFTFSTNGSNSGTTVTERMRITSGGDVFINNSSGVTLNSLTNKLSISSTTYNLFDISRFSDNAFGPNFYLVKSRNGSIGGNTIVANGDNLGNIAWLGANGTGFTDAASIKAEVDGGPGASDMPGRLVFSTTADGATSVTERMRITSGGNVGIGTASPNRKLELITSGGSTLGIAASDNGAGILYGRLAFYTNSNSNEFINYGGEIRSYSGAGIDQSDLRFYTAGVSTSTERMRITSGGLVAIGNDSPSANGASAVIDVGNGSGGTINLRDTNTGLAAEGFHQIYGGDNRMYLYAGGSGASAYMQFYTNDAERMRITSGGNILIGTTTDNGNKLQVNGGASFSNAISPNGGVFALGDVLTTTGRLLASNGSQGANTETASLLLGNRGYFTTSDIGAARISAVATGTFWYSGTALAFYTNPGPDVTSGSAVERMRIAANGSVSIVGSLSKGSGSFKIDHPLSSKKGTHHLVHSFIEGPQADNIYRGKIQLVNSKATINLDQASRMTEGTFVLLNGNIQCFTSNESGWTAVKGIVAGNILTIEAQDPECTDTISWLVVGERIDQHMLDTDWTDENGKVITEPLKQ